MPPVKALFVAEKNSVAKAMVAALGGGQRVQGQSQMNPITECRGEVAAQGQPKQPADIRVTSVQVKLVTQNDAVWNLAALFSSHTANPT